MFDMGFLPGIRKILAKLPRERQNLLFSATMPSEIRGLADQILQQPHVVQLNHSQPASTIDHALYPVHPDRKRDLLDHLLKDEACTSAIVFMRTKHRAKRLAQQLENEGHRAVALQGNMSQAQRDRAMAGFRAGRFEVLVATDIVARGIDVSDVSHVINFDAPNTPDAYTHRIGRTGRKEQSGIACTFVTHEDRAWILATERMIGTPIARRQIEGFEKGLPGGATLDRNAADSRGARPNAARLGQGPSQGQGQGQNQSGPSSRRFRGLGNGGNPNSASRKRRSSSNGRRRSPRAAQG